MISSAVGYFLMKLFLLAEFCVRFWAGIVFSATVFDL